jgi:hypothetical protein
MPLTVTELALKGAKELQAWLDQTDSDDALTALAVTQIALGQAMGRFIELVKNDTDATTKRLEKNTDLANFLRAIYNRGTGNDLSVTLTDAEVTRLNTEMPQVLGDSWKPLNFTTDKNSVGQKINSMISAVSAKGDQISSESSLNQSTLNASTTRYNQAFDLVTTMIKKFSDIQSATAGNLHP